MSMTKEDLIQSSDAGPDLQRLAEFAQALKILIQRETTAIIRLEVPSEPK